MDNQLEQARDVWVNAFFTGNVGKRPLNPIPIF